MIRIQTDDFSLEEIVQSIRHAGVGSIVTFSGIVRETSKDGTHVQKVVWDVYKPMALKVFEAIREKAIQQFDLMDTAIVHRYGSQKPGENLVLIAVASAHRKEAFQACEWIMDEIKKQVPLWKKEILSTGEERWIEG